MLSDSERLITMTKDAYDKLVGRNAELERLVDSRTITLKHKILFMVNHQSTLGDGHFYRERYSSELNAKFYTPEQNDLLSGDIKDILAMARDDSRKFLKIMKDATDEANKKTIELEKLSSELKQNIEEIWRRIPFFIKWFVKPL